MSSTHITIQWGNQIFSNIEIAYNKTGHDLKLILQKITGVAPDAQSVISKSSWTGLLQDDYVFTPENLKTNQKIILIGITPDLNKYRFANQDSDLLMDSSNPVEEVTRTIAKKPVGFKNINNSCYINSVVQVIHQIPEFVEGIESVPRTSLSGKSKRLLFELGEVYRHMEKSNNTQYPFALCKEIRMSPKFNESTNSDYGNVYKQQDADELFTYILNASESVLKDTESSESTKVPSKSDKESLVNSLFGYTVNCEYKCTESDEVYYTQENLTKLYCNIDGGVNAKIPVNTVYDGIKLSQETTLEKHSDKLNRNAKWIKTSKITELPQYFYIQMMRFYWKEDDREPSGGYPCKIMRKVSFPDRLDALKFLEDGKAKELEAYRDALGEDDIINSLVETEDPSLKDTICASLVPYDKPLGPHLPITFYGKYSLAGIISHKGSRLDNGHYNAWIRNKTKDYDQWYQCDDDNVTSVLSDKIKDLRGGSENHSAYILIYKYDNIID